MKISNAYYAVKTKKTYGLYEKIFTVLLGLFIILNAYSVNIGGLSLGFADVFLLFIIPVGIIKIFLRKKLVLEKSTFFFLVVIFIHFIFFPPHADGFIDTVHFMIILFILAFFCPVFFDTNVGVKCVIYVSFISSIYLILQFILLHTIGFYLPGHLEMLEPAIAVTGNIRPFAFFTEPAEFGIYNCIGLATILYCENVNRRKKNILCIIISIGILLAQTTTGAGLMLIVWMVWVFDHKKQAGKYVLLFFAVGIPALMYLDMKFGIIQSIYQHSLAGIMSGDYASGLVGRVGNIESALSYYDGAAYIEKLFGTGMFPLQSKDVSFLPSVGRINLYYGISGYLIIFIFLIWNLVHTGKYGRCLMLTTIVSLFFMESIFGVALIRYMPLVIAFRKSDNIQVPIGLKEGRK